MLDLGIYWRAREKPRGDYLIAVQLRDAADRIVVAAGSPPARGTYPTSRWNIGEVLLDWHAFDLPSDVRSGEYKIFVALFDSASQKVLAETFIATISIAR